jgi:hypothetical protein
VSRDDALLPFPIPDPPSPFQLGWRARLLPSQGHGAEDNGYPEDTPVDLVVRPTSDLAGAVQTVSYTSSNADVLQ